MALNQADESTLLLPLLSGAAEDPRWCSFLKLVTQRTGAERALLVLRPSPGSSVAPFVREERRSGLQGARPLDAIALQNDDILPLSSLRRHRVYALAELARPSSDSAREVVSPSSIIDARMVRLSAGACGDAWLIITGGPSAFSATDSALMSALVPFVAHAIMAYAQETALIVRAAGAERVLARLGIGLAHVDTDGKPIAGDSISVPASSDADEGGILSHRADGRALLTLPAQATGSAWAATMLWRDQPEDRAERSIAAFARQFQLSSKEASLAWAIAQGTPLIDAGVRLGLTAETTRNYSKRIFLKTGTRGQPDLVRLFHHSLAPLA